MGVVSGGWWILLFFASQAERRGGIQTDNSISEWGDMIYDYDGVMWVIYDMIFLFVCFLSPLTSLLTSRRAPRRHPSDLIVLCCDVIPTGTSGVASIGMTPSLKAREGSRAPRPGNSRPVFAAVILRCTQSDLFACSGLLMHLSYIIS